MSKNPWENQEFLEGYAFLETQMLIKQELYDAIFRMIPPATSNDLHALDVGSGLSTISDRIKSLGYHYHGIDNSLNMLTKALALNPKLDRHIAQATLLNTTPIASESVSLLILVNVLYTFSIEELREKVLPEISRIVKRNSLVISVNPLPNANNLKIITRELRLRGLSPQTVIKFIGDVIKNRQFIKDQAELAETALKLYPAAWQELMAEFDLELEDLNEQTYAGQASILAFRKKNSNVQEA